jgi:hypothetical protein
MTVTPYVDSRSGRLTYSYRATGMHAPATVSEARAAKQVA